MNNPIEKQYRLSEAASLLGLRECTLRKWATLRKIKVHKVGGATRLPESELRRLIYSNVIPAREVCHE